MNPLKLGILHAHTQIVPGLSGGGGDVRRGGWLPVEWKPKWQVRYVCPGSGSQGGPGTDPSDIPVSIFAIFYCAQNPYVGGTYLANVY